MQLYGTFEVDLRCRANKVQVTYGLFKLGAILVSIIFVFLEYYNYLSKRLTAIRYR